MTDSVITNETNNPFYYDIVSLYPHTDTAASISKKLFFKHYEEVLAEEQDFEDFQE